ncbi:RNA ligase RtcB family protein [Entomohabitans teleogrylli]|uniref:RNA ligase RtcB family protein n=1 Tax=Entomohabitans teleogrylli TaxID=1384589 RepID=UPI00073D4AEC|nr:RNA ligase RtcB family protein [Entomohabitans teleogrylli]
MGNIIRPLSDVASWIASENLWIESSALQQLNHTASLPGMLRVVGMPDLHPGRGYPIGAACFSAGRFYPALVGNDIGCGMGLWQTDLVARRLNLDKLEKRLQGMADIAASSWLDERLEDDFYRHPFRAALGSIGGGNHFAEFQQVETLLDSDVASQAGVQVHQLLLLVHSGSRGVGQHILQHHITRFSHHGLEIGSPEAQRYLRDHDAALAFARLNRQLIAGRLLEQFRAQGERLLDLFHNLLEPAQLGDIQGILHRKGATPSDKGLVILPGSRGDYSYLLQPTACEQSLWSLAHGAGRKWMRTECKGRLSAKFSPQQLSRTALGSRVICRDRQLIYEEAPQAYKSVDSVLDCLVQAGLAKPVARLRPLLTWKTSGERSA